MDMYNFSDNAYWETLADRYLNADTTADEERSLRQFLASDLADSRFDGVRAVIGLAIIGKRRHRRQQRRAVLLSSAAAAAIILLSVIPTLHRGNDICVAYINGSEYSDKNIVLAQMQASIDEMAIQSKDLSVDKQMSNFFEQQNN